MAKVKAKSNSIALGQSRAEVEISARAGSCRHTQNSVKPTATAAANPQHRVCLCRADRVGKSAIPYPLRTLSEKATRKMARSWPRNRSPPGANRKKRL